MSLMRALAAELIFAARRLAADRWAAGAAILAVAIGTGLNTTVFAAAYGILLRPLPYADPARLAVVTRQQRVDRSEQDFPRAQIDEWRQRSRGAGLLAAYRTTDFVVRGVGEPRLTHVALVSDEFFDVLRPSPLRGRLWSDAKTASASASDSVSASDSGAAIADRTGAVVISERFALDVFGSLEVVGRPLTVGQTAFAVSAVLPRRAAFPTEQVDLWLPITAVPPVQFFSQLDAGYFRFIARLPDSVAADAAAWSRVRESLQGVLVALDPTAADARRGSVVSIAPIEDALVERVRPVIVTFAAGVALVLLIACANVATILVGRAVARQHELAIQRALGADAVRLVASMAAESIVIAVAGSLAGLSIALGAVQVLRTLGAGLLPRVDSVAIDWPVLAFTCLLSIIVATLAAVVPARRGLAGSMDSLRVKSASPGRPARRARAALAVLQVALAVVVLAGAALLVQTVVGLLSIDVGVEPRNAVTMRLMLTETTSYRAAEREPLVQELVERVRALPGVQHVGIGSNLPPARQQFEIHVRIVTKTLDKVWRGSVAGITPGYLQALGVRLVRGRSFDDQDAAHPRANVLISESAARRLYGSLDVIGKTLLIRGPGAPADAPKPTIVGVVQDVKYFGLEAPTEMSIYVPWQALPTGDTFLAVRSTNDPVAMAGTLRRLVREIDPALPIVDSQPLAQVIGSAVADRRLRALLGGSIALLAFAVALVGLAGGLLHAVVERRRELAIRAALGATPRRAVRMILTEGALLTAAGLTLGLGIVLAVGSMLTSLLYGVKPSDPPTLAAVALFVALVSLTACYLPARRAAAADPLELLRSE